MQETGLGLIRPGNGRLTKLLEILFGWSSTFRLHALYHDVFRRIYLKTKKGPGYTYIFRNCIFKGSPLFRHLTELLSCILFGKKMENIIVNRFKFLFFISNIPHSENSHKEHILKSFLIYNTA